MISFEDLSNRVAQYGSPGVKNGFENSRQQLRVFHENMRQHYPNLDAEANKKRISYKAGADVILGLHFRGGQANPHILITLRKSTNEAIPEGGQEYFNRNNNNDQRLYDYEYWPSDAPFEDKLWELVDKSYRTVKGGNPPLRHKQVSTLTQKHSMEYFDFSKLPIFKEKAETPYEANSELANWCHSTREKLYYLVELLDKKTGRSLHVNYTERVLKQGGRGKGPNHKGYILTGFIPKELFDELDNLLFIKLCIHAGKSSGTPSLSVEIDINFKKHSPFRSDRDWLQSNYYYTLEMNDQFPSNWDDLVKEIAPTVQEYIAGLESYLDDSNMDAVEEDEGIYEANQDGKAKNTILYGPPGTGKTYRTINRALSIIEGEDYLNGKSRGQLKDRFTELLDKEQIIFTTFHQSMSYEDFVEGLKPVEKNGGISYETVPGIFKKIVDNAKGIQKGKAEGGVDNYEIEAQTLEQARFFKMSLGDTSNSEESDIYNYCIENNRVAMGWGEHIDFSNAKDESEIKQLIAGERSNLEEQSPFVATAVTRFLFWMKPDDIVFISNGNRSVRAIGLIKGGYEFDTNTPIQYNHFREVEWLYYGVDIPIKQVYSRNLSQQSIYMMEKNEIDLEFFKSRAGSSIPKKNHVLIIDEINRGNIAAILGELITLLEPDKRKGEKEELEVTLPYSKEPFSVPSNLYIIGTMNTADRSVEALDTALRRRFEFVEMPPRPDLLSNIEVEDINLEKLLTAINQRIEVLIDKDHCIGHSAFIKLQDAADKLDGLKKVFQNKLIPQLQEYFYGNFGKIAMIIGKSFFDRFQPNNEVKFMEVEDLEFEAFNERPIYRFKNISDMTDDEFIAAVKKIYA